MNLLGIGVVLILVGAVLALAVPSVSSFGWLLAVGGLVCIIVYAVMAVTHRRGV